MARRINAAIIALLLLAVGAMLASAKKKCGKHGGRKCKEARRPAADAAALEEGGTNPILATRAVVPALTVADNVGLWQVKPGDCDAQELALKGIGIPYTLHTVAAGPNPDVKLAEADGTGKYSLLVFCSNRLLYPSGGQYISALTDAQWAQLNEYQVKYGVRRVEFNVWPGPAIGVKTPPYGGCCSNETHGSNEQYITLAPQALPYFGLTGIKLSAKLSSAGMWHFPTTLLDGPPDPANGKATPIIHFGTTPKVFNNSTQPWVGGVITEYPNLREEMNFFLAVGPWSTSSVVLQQLWIHWGLRSCYPGFRRVHLVAQVDDIFLPSPITVNRSAPAAPSLWDKQNNTEREFRINADDIRIHQAWQRNLNTRLPAGSNVALELGFNGNGVLLVADETQAILTDDRPDVPHSLHYKKPIGTGVNAWPATPTKFAWSPFLLMRDPLYFALLFTPGLKSDFFWVQHTFTHMDLNNATFSDAAKEISFNKAFASWGYFGLDGKPYYSPKALIPPAISGLLNGDALRAFKDNGITYVCGDNTRSELLNSVSSFYPLKTTVADNGYEGITIIPRYSTNIYYNVSTFAEEEYLYNTIYYGTPNAGTWMDIYKAEVDRATRQLLSLHHDAYMFHQANMRASDITQKAPPYFPNGRFSLLMLWMEMVTESVASYVSWPMVSRPMQEMAEKFLDRENRDTCGVKVDKLLNGTHLTGVRITGGTKQCTWPISVPGGVKGDTTATSQWRFERLSGVDPLTVWIPTTPGQVQTVLLDPAVPWKTAR